jgi:hypothetical protein
MLEIMKDCEIEDLVASSVWEDVSSYDTTEDVFVCHETVATIGTYKFWRQWKHTTCKTKDNKPT